MVIESLDAKPVGIIHSLTIDRDGQYLAIAGRDGITWQAHGGSPVVQQGARAQRTRSVSFSPDGSQLASGGADGWIYLWQAGNDPTQTATLLGRLKAPVIALGWFEAETIVAVGADGLIVEFSLEPQFLKSKACEVAHPDLTQEEARQLFGDGGYHPCA